MRTVTDIEGKTIFPISQLLSPESVPSDIVEFDGALADLFNHIFYAESSLQAVENGYAGIITLVIDHEMSLVLFNDVIQLVIGGSGLSVFEVEISLESQPGGLIFNLVLVDVSVVARISSNILRPLKNGTLEPDLEATSVDIELGAVTIQVGTHQAINVQFVGDLAVPQCMIGDTGIVISVMSIQWLTPEIDALPINTPPEFSGFHLERVMIQLPEGLNDILPDDVTLEDFFIGSGGFYGKVTGNWEVDPENPIDAGSGDVFGFRFRLTNIAIEFIQNTLVSGGISGYLQLPFFDEPVQVELGLTNNGDFTIALANPDGLLTLEKDGIISIEVTSLEFIKEGNTYAIKLSGKITPLLAGLNWPSFELKGLTIGTDGTVSVDGGWIELPDQKVLDFHGFQIEIAKLGFGSDEEDGVLYKWVGFSGGIQIIQALPLRGGVEGLKVMWSQDGQFKLKIGGVYLSFEIKDVLTFDGSVYFIDEENPDIKEFRGSVDLNLIPINLGIDAQFITGKTADYNYFYIAVGLDLPVGIPLGPPVLGLYGLAGLYGHNMTLDYQRLVDYDDVADRPDLADVGNWFNQKDAMAFGAGLTVGTLPDTKFIVKVKALFVILIPGPVLLIEGQAGMLSLGENYLMKVLAVLDPSSGTFLMNISAEYQFPKASGDLLNISGSAEAYFSAADPSSWHLYLGENLPESKRIRADILNFFKAQTYLMLDHDGLLMGAWIGYGLDKKYGILRVILEAWMSGELGISTMPLQAKGSVTLYGNAELSASIVSLGISVEANVTAEAPKPLYISAFLEVQLKTPLGKPKAKITLKWEEQGVPSFPIPLSTTLGVEHRKVTKNWEIPKYSPYALDTDGLYANLEIPVGIPAVPVVPPDVYLTLNFDKSVIDVTMVGANPDVISKYEKVGDYEFKYELKKVTLASRDTWNETSDNNDDDWLDFLGPLGDYSLTGYWQFIPNTDAVANTKLILNASSPFEISRVLEDDDLWYTMLNVYNPDYPCYGETVLEEICADFEMQESMYYYGTLIRDGFVFSSPHPMVVHGYQALWLGTEKALNNTDGYQTIECLNIKSQEPTEAINLKVIKDVLITAGIGYDSYLKFTDAYSEGDIELYVNLSSLDLANGIIPVFVHFPKISFGDTPFRVYISCIASDTPTYLFYAFDDDGEVIDKVKINEGNKIGDTVIYTLEAEVPIRKIGLLGNDFRILDICYEVHHTVENTNILVTLPQEVIHSQVHISKDSEGTIYLYDKENTEIKQLVFSIPVGIPDDEVLPITLEMDGQLFQSFLVLGRFDIIRVCGVTQEAQENYDYNAGLSTHLQSTVEENWGKHTAQILQPNKYYRLKIETATSRIKNGGSWEVRDFNENMYFKTGNPPGPPADTQVEVEDTMRYDLEGPLMNLNAYIDFTIPAGSTADEAQPFVFRSYDIGLVFNDSYIEQMYQMAGLPIRIRLLDNNNLPVLNAAGEVLEFVNAWGDNPELSLTREETRYEDILDDRGCIIMTGVTPETNKEILASSRDLLLKPQTQYRAQVLAGDIHSVYEFAFISSRYASFMHQVYSFENVAWSYYELLNNADYAVDASVLEQILSNSEESQVKFEQLMGLLDLNPRMVPERTEITLINDLNQSVGLLLETPEPVDWIRTSLKLSFVAEDHAIQPFNSTIKIVKGDLAAAQWVEVFFLESADISDWAIEYRALDSDDYLEYFRFPTGSSYNAGTCVRINNGEESRVTSGETEYIDLYADHATDSFSMDGIVTRIKDTADEIIHERTIHNDAVFSEQEITIIGNADGSKCFIFLKDGGQQFSALGDGVYHMDFTYLRDLGDPAYPILRRFGSTANEEATLEFSLPAFSIGELV